MVITSTNANEPTLLLTCISEALITVFDRLWNLSLCPVNIINTSYRAVGGWFTKYGKNPQVNSILLVLWAINKYLAGSLGPANDPVHVFIACPKGQQKIEDLKSW